MHAFLIGGGQGSSAAHRPFVQAAAGPIVAFVLDEGADTDPARWAETLRTAGAPEVRTVVVSPSQPPRPADLAEMAGIYVAGGLTPGYHAALLGQDTEWLHAARAANLVYGGFSAGAAIAPHQALVGGWRTTFRGQPLEVCHEDCAEDLDDLSVLPGLGLVPFLVDVHAAQWGTLNRLVHAVASSTTTSEGWAIDEHTCLETSGDSITVHGRGAATRVRTDGDQFVLTIHLAGDRITALG